jgi:hypothetical protein
MPESGTRRSAIIILQILVGSIVALGGFAFASFAIGQFGMALGIIHFSVGVTELITGFYMLRTRSALRRVLLATNGITIGYSTFSESLVQLDSLLPAGPSLDSMVGTIIAIAMSCVVIYYVWSSR